MHNENEGLRRRYRHGKILDGVGDNYPIDWRLPVVVLIVLAVLTALTIVVGRDRVDVSSPVGMPHQAQGRETGR